MTYLENPTLTSFDQDVIEFKYQILNIPHHFFTAIISTELVAKTLAMAFICKIFLVRLKDGIYHATVHTMFLQLLNGIDDDEISKVLLHQAISYVILVAILGRNKIGRKKECNTLRWLQIL